MGVGLTRDDEDEEDANLSSESDAEMKAHVPANLLHVNGLISSQANGEALSGYPIELSSIMFNDVSGHERRKSDDFNQVQNFSAHHNLVDNSSNSLLHSILNPR